MNSKWYVTTKDIDEVVEAADQWEAFDSLRSRAASEFGLVVEAQPVNETRDESMAVRTSLLFNRWGYPEIARRFIEAAVAAGLPDTSESDL